MINLVAEKICKNLIGVTLARELEGWWMPRFLMAPDVYQVPVSWPLVRRWWLRTVNQSLMPLLKRREVPLILADPTFSDPITSLSLTTKSISSLTYIFNGLQRNLKSLFPHGLFSSRTVHLIMHEIYHNILALSQERLRYYLWLVLYNLDHS